MNGRDLKIALVYNLEDDPIKGEPHDSIALKYTANTSQSLYATLRLLGYPTYQVAVQHSLEELRRQLSELSPEDTFVFNNCDGFAGENYGAVHITQAIEDLGFKHTGSAAATVALCTEKALAKERLIGAGVPTPAYQVFSQPAGEIKLDFPVIVKPIKEDASLGIDLKSVACSQADVYERIQYVLERYNQPAIVEEFIAGREFAVSMWGNSVVEALPVTEEDYSRISNPLECLLTYEAKWIAESHYFQNIFVRCPAPLVVSDQQCVVETAIACYQAIGLRDFGRVDIRYHDGVPYIIDVNELPDLSPDAGFPNTAITAGYTYAEMVEHILDLALRREGWR